MIPAKYTCDGEDINPPLFIKEVLEGVRSLVLIFDDPDSPTGNWVHWVVINISPSVSLIEENSAPQGAIEGMNDFGKNSYGGPCPGSGVHGYFFKLYALDRMFELEPSVRKEDVEKAMEGAILDYVELVGVYERQ